MPIRLDNAEFFTIGEVADAVGVSRQTVWRWKKARRIPPGRRYRGRELLFTREEAHVINAYAHRMETDDAPTTSHFQLPLFGKDQLESTTNTI